MIIGIACALLPVRELRSMIDNRVRVLMDRWSLELSGDVRMRDCGGLRCVGKSWSVRARGARADRSTRTKLSRGSRAIGTEGGVSKAYMTRRLDRTIINEGE